MANNFSATRSILDVPIYIFNLFYIMKTIKKMIYTSKDRENLMNSYSCHICLGHFSEWDKRVEYHYHFTDSYSICI